MQCALFNRNKSLQIKVLYSKRQFLLVHHQIEDDELEQGRAEVMASRAVTVELVELVELLDRPGSTGGVSYFPLLLPFFFFFLNHEITTNFES